MKKLVLILSCILVCTIFTSQAQELAPKAPKALRFMSYNVRICLGMDNQTDPDRVAAVINRVEPDVVAIQEIDSITERVSWANQMVQLSEKTGMHYIFGHAVDRSKGKYGIGMLSKEKPIRVRKVPLPGTEEPRLLLIAEFKNYIVCCTHFSLNEQSRIASAEIVIRELEGVKKPTLLGGDFNALPDSKPIEMLRTKFELLSDDAFLTFPSDKPNRCLDYIWGYKLRNKKYDVTQRVAIDEPMASDHVPLVVDVKF